MKDRDRLLRRIRSLLVVSKDPGATGPERETARRLADQLMAANGLTEADIPERQVERPRSIIFSRPFVPPRFIVVDLFSNQNGFGFSYNCGTNNTNGFYW